MLRSLRVACFARACEHAAASESIEKISVEVYFELFQTSFLICRVKLAANRVARIVHLILAVVHCLPDSLRGLRRPGKGVIAVKEEQALPAIGFFVAGRVIERRLKPVFVPPGIMHLTDTPNGLSS